MLTPKAARLLGVEPGTDEALRAAESAASDEARRAVRLVRLGRLAIAQGCAAAIPEAEREGCGCWYRCLRGRSARPNGGVTPLDCEACPEAPPL
jgi:hypothetical protein